MKWFIASDIHGSAHFCEKMLAAFEKEGADRLLLLGDILYHGPRNDLPIDYAPKRVAAMLNRLRDVILCVRGNCDGEIDQKVLDFDILSNQLIICEPGRTIYVNHGHDRGESAPPPMTPGSVLLCGHTHIPAFNRHEDFIYVNPGSTSIPKADSAHGYMTMEDGRFIWKDMDGNILRQEQI